MKDLTVLKILSQKVSVHEFPVDGVSATIENIVICKDGKTYRCYLMLHVANSDGITNVGDFQDFTEIKNPEISVSSQLYQITSQWVGDSAPATLEQIEDLVAGWEGIPGWNLVVRVVGTDVRIVANRVEDKRDEDEWLYNTPSRNVNWIKPDSMTCYHVIGSEIDDE